MPHFKNQQSLASEAAMRTQTEILIIGAGPTGMALSIALHQAGVDHLLLDRLSERQNTSRAAVIHRGVTATRVEQDGTGARVTVNGPDGEQVISARYVVGADGMHSLVRQASGIGFEGGTYEDSFVLADVRLE